MENIREELLDLLIEAGMYDEPKEKFDDCRFVGIFEELDSLNLINLVINIENKFDVEFPDEYLNFNVFTSLDQLAGIIHQLKNSST